ncbi:MAG: M15 family metallopeptidase [Cyanobacteria bacterium J06626_23]
MKPHYSIPIHECGDPLVPIPLATFAVVHPHPYAALGAPYGDRSPYYLRQPVLAALTVAQASLQERQPGWRLQIFDAYRPVAVQQFMVDYTYQQLIKQRDLNANLLTSQQQAQLLEQVHTFWAVPSPDPATPPPHSTGAVIDLTLVDDQEQPIDMGSPIDEISDRSYPNHFQHSSHPGAQTYHQNRSTLAQVMATAGFRQHPNEWWHFSLGDQLWAWLDQAPAARYGRV